MSEPAGANDLHLQEDSFHEEDLGGSSPSLPSPDEYKAGIGWKPKSSSGLFGRRRDPEGFEPSQYNPKTKTFGDAADDDNDDENDEIPQDIGYDPEQLQSGADVQKRAAGGKSDGIFWKRFGIVSFVVMVIVIVITLSITLPRRDENGGGSHTAWHRDSDRFRRLKDYLVANRISVVHDLEDESTPQHYAAQWLAHKDPMQLEISDSSSSSENLSKDHNTLVERYSLTVFYYATGGPNWNNNLNFLSGAHVCAWYSDFFIEGDDDSIADSILYTMGVHGCKDVGDGELAPFSLFVPHNNLVGTLPGELQHLDRLEIFALEHNPDLTGTIPRGLSGMESLRRLALQWCSFTGVVPTWIGKMPSLSFLGLGNNLLEGPVPKELFTLTNLQLLGLDDNALSAQISDFYPLSNLRSLYLEDNNITGTISEALLASWPRLQELDLSGNKLSGELPDNFFNHEMHLVVLDLHDNEFSGELPSNTWENDELEFLALHGNKFRGTLTTEDFIKFKALRHLDISHNRFGGEMPNLGTMNRLEYLFLGGNGFASGPFPTWITELTNLRELSLKGSSVTGEFPAAINYLSNLEFLDLHFNKIEGSIPSFIGFLSGLKHLLLKNNQMTGQLPTELDHLTNLEVLLLEQNNFSGDANMICSQKESFDALTMFVSDCAGEKLNCPCCSICCEEGDKTCNAFDWEGNLDPIWEYGFKRERYSYEQGPKMWVP